MRALSACEVGPWTADDARRWWATEGAGLARDRPRTKAIGMDRTLDVDVADRLGGAPTEAG